MPSPSLPITTNSVSSINIKHKKIFLLATGLLLIGSAMLFFSQYETSQVSNLSVVYPKKEQIGHIDHDDDSYIPSQFDMRFIPEAEKCDFIAKEEGICVGGNWAYQITETVKSTLCIGQTQIQSLSAQHLLECSGVELPCQHFEDLDILKKAFNFISTNGVAYKDCLPYDPLQPTASNCRTQCVNGTTIIDTVKANFVEIKDLDTVMETMMNDGPILMIMNYTTSLSAYNSGLYKHDASDRFLGYRLVKLVGWDTPEGYDFKYWIAENTFSPNWGSIGYFAINQTDSYILNYYGINSTNLDKKARNNTITK